MFSTVIVVHMKFIQARREPQWGILAGFRTISRGPSWEFFFQNGTFWRTLYFWATAGPPNVAEPGVAYPPLPHTLDGPEFIIKLLLKLSMKYDADKCAKH